MQAAAAPNERTEQSPNSAIEEGEDHTADPPSPRATERRHQYWHPSGFVYQSTSWRRAQSRHAAFDESAFVAEDDRLDAVAQVELREQARDVRLDGRCLDDELGRDL